MSAAKIPKDIEDKLDKTRDEVEYDDLLSSAGELGRYQWVLFFSTCPFFAFGVFVYCSQMFMTEVSPNHWCRIPELENLTDFQRRDLGVPKDENARFGYSQCEMYAVNWTEVLATAQTQDPTWSRVPCQHGWEFNKTEIPYPTIGSDWEWVCEKSSYQATAQALFFFGSIVGGIIFGWVADRYGRIPAITGSCLVGCAGGTISTFARNLMEFSAARFVMGMSYDTCMNMPYLLILEYVAPRYRTLLSNMSFAIFYSLFVTVIPWIALACGHWKTISLVTSLPFALAIFTKWILPESPRWLLAKDRVDDAVEKVLIIGRSNKKEVPLKMIEQFKASFTNAKKEDNQSFLEIFRRPVIRKLFILVCIEHMCCNIVFDGLLRNISQYDFDFFISFSVISFTEFPSVVVVAFIMDPIGRRWLCVICMGICCVFCVMTVFTSGIETLIFAVIARTGLNMAYSAVLQWVPELLPTPVRGSGLAIVHVCGYVAAFLSPYIVYLKEYVFWLPSIIIGATAGLAMLIAFTLPETSMKEMPHSFKDTEELTRNQKIWTLPFLEYRKEKNQIGQTNQSFELES